MISAWVHKYATIETVRFKLSMSGCSIMPRAPEFQAKAIFLLVHKWWEWTWSGVCLWMIEHTNSLQMCHVFHAGSVEMKSGGLSNHIPWGEPNQQPYGMCALFGQWHPCCNPYGWKWDAKLEESIGYKHIRILWYSIFNTVDKYRHSTKSSTELFGIAKERLQLTPFLSK